MRRAIAVALQVAQIAALIAIAVPFSTTTARSSGYTCQAGKDGSPGSLSGAYNTYYQPPSGTLSAGSSSVNLGTIDTGGGGASTAVAAGDLLLIIQMQDGSFTHTNDSTYGSGASLGNAGLYEYVQVASVAGSVATIVGAGSGGGLVNSYTEAAANAASGQKTYQIIRVPQYITATLTSTFHAAYWDGKTGGVAALDIASTLNLNGASIYATGDGFRGGGVSIATTTPNTILNNDWAASATMNGADASVNPPGHGFKGEGIFGTPAYVFGYTNFSTPSTPSSPAITKTATDGYPGGDMARGAPGNAGGGGTDADPKSNDQNTGGGGGANGGAGGNGGYPWTPQEPNYPYNASPGIWDASTKPYAANGANNNADIGGRGASVIATSGRALMGGGGGAGSNNNGSNNNSYNAYGSSGGTGGGIVMMRIANTSGATATIYADGTTGLAPDNDGGGGGGAGGTVVITSPNAFSNINVYARGAAGTTAYATTSDTSSTTAHGPGGGGGGGMVYTSSPVTAVVTGGANGTTVYGTTNAYGSTSGSSGSSSTISASQVPGVPSGAECYSGSQSSSGTGTMYNGPYDAAEATYFGADETGSYDGTVGVDNNHDFTARSIPALTGTYGNSSTNPASPSPTGSLSLASVQTIDVPHEFYYNNTDGLRHTLTFNAQAPVFTTNWTAQVCADNAGAINCSITANSCKNSTKGLFISQGAAANSTSATFCWGASAGNAFKYWVRYQAQAGTYTPLSRLDGWILAQDDQATPAQNTTHDEFFAGYVLLTKTANVIASGCSGSLSPSIPASDATGARVCPGGKIQYTIDYRNIVGAGANRGSGTEWTNNNTGAFPATGAGSLTISDDGTQSTVSSTTAPNWATFSNGIAESLNASVSGNSSCGVTYGNAKCGDTTSGTVFTYYKGIPATTAVSFSAGNPPSPNITKFSAQIGGAAYRLYPPGVGGQPTTATTLTFYVVVK